MVLAANSLPAINDITAAELDALLPALCAADDTICRGVSSGRLRVVASGSGLPVIDLSRVRTSVGAPGGRAGGLVPPFWTGATDLPPPAPQLSPELAEACAGADLIVLEGMGRAIETNLRASLACDSLKLGMVKHPEVAAALGGPGGRMYDCVCRFERGQQAAC